MSTIVDGENLTRGPMHVREIAWLEPPVAAARLRPLGGLAFLDSAMRHSSLGRYSYVTAAPFGRLVVEHGRSHWNGEQTGKEPLYELAQLMRRFAHQGHEGLPPFQTGAIGFFSYEMGRLIERLPRPAAAAVGPVPEIMLGFYDVVVAFDQIANRTWIVSSGYPEKVRSRRLARARERAELFEARLAFDVSRAPGPAPPIPRSRWSSNFERKNYETAVARVIHYILEGDIFQANVAQRLISDLPFGYDPWAFYLKLRRRNAATFCAYLELGEFALASSSPERFLKVENREVETRPIKGTAPRANDPEQDSRSAEALLASEKDRAENIMIVDLLRNDLSRVCRPHSVKTPTLVSLESYAGVHHLVSSVTGRLMGGKTALDVLVAAFPGGSVTGAPKLRAMEIITEIEREARGAYCGAIGCLGFNGFMDTNIAIRTVTFLNGQASFHVGGGITALSNPAAEYQETLDKAERILQAFEEKDSCDP